MKLLLITDAWHPQINGVVNTLTATARELRRQNHHVEIIAPDTNHSIALPFYPEITLDFHAQARIKQALTSFAPDSIHIATEGPLGWTARRLCLRQNRPFTTAYHTRFPEYLAARAPRPLACVIQKIAYATLRRFHAPAQSTMVATAALKHELAAQNFKNLSLWSRGVDTDLFQPYGKDLAAYADLPRPLLLYVGRVAIEKNLPAFLALQTTGSKVVIGTGPDLDTLRQHHPEAHFLGAMTGETLARHYAAADLFVFPSTTDTFGLVLLEACASGLRIAATQTPDIFATPETSTFLSQHPDLQTAVTQALSLPATPQAPRAFATRYSWQECTRQFVEIMKASKQWSHSQNS